MKTKSAKAKARRLQNHVVDVLRENYSLGEEIKPAIMGEGGIDIKLSPKGKETIPFDIECKNTERLDLWGSLAQAEANAEAGRIPLLIFTRNRSDVYAVLKLDDLLEVLP